MGRTSKKKSRPSTMKKLKTALTEIALSAPGLSFGEGEAYVCSVCQLPVRLCNTDPTKKCASMLLDGTELQLIRRAGKERSSRCIRCGGPIPQRILKKDPLTEICPSCQRSSSKPKLLKRSKGVSL